MIDPRHGHALETFLGVADAVAEVLRANTEWGASGLRDGQYAVDLDADRACLDRLLAGGVLGAVGRERCTGPRPIEPVVVVDPLDGSTNASRGVPWFGTALCLVDDDGPAVGVRREPRDAASGSRRSAGTGPSVTVWAIAVSACETLGGCARRSERAAGPPLRLGAVPRARRLGARHLRRRRVARSTPGAT